MLEVKKEIQRYNGYLLDDVIRDTEQRMEARDYECIIKSIENGQRYILSKIEEYMRNAKTMQEIRSLLVELKCQT